MSMIPAFSPGPCNTCLLRVGRRFKCTRDDLYEQCSLHITLKMPSSVMVGSRPPRSCLIFSYSSGVRPCCRIVSGEKAEFVGFDMGRSFYCRIFNRAKDRVTDSISRIQNAQILVHPAAASSVEERRFSAASSV